MGGGGRATAVVRGRAATAAAAAAVRVAAAAVRRRRWRRRRTPSVDYSLVTSAPWILKVVKSRPIWGHTFVETADGTETAECDLPSMYAHPLQWAVAACLGCCERGLEDCDI